MTVTSKRNDAVGEAAHGIEGCLLTGHVGGGGIGPLTDVRGSDWVVAAGHHMGADSIGPLTWAAAYVRGSD